MKLLVAGGSGFIGRQFLVHAPRDWEIVATYRQATNFPRFLAERGLEFVRPVRVDLGNVSQTETAFRGDAHFDTCLFLAADTRVRALVEDPRRDLTGNLAPLLNTLQSIRCGRFVFLSSGAVYMGRHGLVDVEAPLSPTIPYAIAKYASELYVQAARRQGRIGGYVVLRFFGAYGPLEPERKLTAKLLETILRGSKKFTVFGDGDNLIDAMYIDDAVGGLLAVLQSDVNDVTVDFCSGHPLTINDWVVRSGTVLGAALEIEHRGESPEYIEFYASPEPMHLAFGFRPSVDLEDGFLRYAEWWKASHRTAQSLNQPR